MSQIEFRLLDILELLEDDNKADLIREYSEESKCDAVPDYFPDKVLYKTMDDNNMLDTIGAFDNGKLVGFIVSITYVLPKYSDLGTTVEYLFVLKEYRSGGTGLKLIKKIEQLAKERGSIAFFLSAPVDGSLDKIATRSLGLSKSHIIYSKSLT